MMKLSMSAAILAILVTTACRSRPTKVVVESPDKPQTVVVQKEHNHDGHYLHNGVWYSDPQFVHVVHVD